MQGTQIPLLGPVHRLSGTGSFVPAMDQLYASFPPCPLQSDTSEVPPDTSSNLASEAFISVVTNRKGWKSFKDGEVVWPLELEAALLEGMEKYVPRNMREIRNLGRFPMRNRFISEYIYHKTGKRRTPKQVGSRLQQLRDTCAGKKLLELLHAHLPPKKNSTLRSSIVPGLKTSSRPPTPGCDLDACSDHSCDTSVDSPITPTETTGHCDKQFTRGESPGVVEINVVYIDLIPPEDHSPTQNEVKTPGMWGELPPHPDNHSNHTRGIQLSQPRHLRDIDPTIGFVSRPIITGHSVFRVRMNDTLVFTEHVPLEFAGRLTDATDDAYGSHLYRTPLVPGYWDGICDNANPTQFTIEHDVQPDAAAVSKCPLFSAVYKFRYSQSQGSIHSIDQQSDSIETGPCLDNILAGDPGLSTLSQFINLEDHALLTELNMLTMRRSPSRIVDWSDDQSVSSFSDSLTSSRHHSVSPLGSCISEAATNILYTPSPTLAEVALPVLANDPAKDNSALCLGYSIEDFFNMNAMWR